MLNFYINSLYFVLYSMLGWLSEVIYCSIPRKKFINRGFLNGPYCPVYGFGALLVIHFLWPFYPYPLLVFLLGIIVTSLLEYITSFLLEKLFHAHWWDYSQHHFNIHGRVCLLNSTLFGLLCLILVYGIHPFLTKGIFNIPSTFLPLIVMGFNIILCVDIVVTLYTITSLKDRVHSISELNTTLKEKLYLLENKLSSLEEKHLLSEGQRNLRCAEFITYLENEMNKKVAIKNILHDRLLDAFPSFHFIHLEEYISKLRDRLK
ncbi:putative ABC transporter permease [Niameybacter massiliensis]|uniref:putative ABC transporter permease n=1 Tax=Niameybacter massiliensis TaxID=1658108 RepID=UPI0006B4CA21|nr:putative ABC transporter permease [Niameybacter massiliensis]